MKQLMLAASAFAIFAAPAHAQLLGGGGGLGGLGGVTGSLNGAIGSTLRGSTDTLRSTTRSTVRGDATTHGDQNVDRRSGDVSIDRSLDTSVDTTADQLVDTQMGSAAGDAAASGRASGSGSANASLIGTDTVRGAVQESVGRVRDGGAQVRNLATPAIGAARERASGLASQAGNVTGSASGAASGAGSLGNSMLAVAGSGAAEGAGAFVVAPGMPVSLPSGEQLGTVRDILATRRGEIRELVIATRNGLTKVPASDFTASGDALIAGSASGSNSNEARAENTESE